jgi:hypothetical protein
VTDTTLNEPSYPSRLPGRPDRPDIKLPNGDTLKPRARLAFEQGVCERSVARMRIQTVLIANVAYVSERSFLEKIAKGLHTPKREPPKRRRK